MILRFDFRKKKGPLKPLLFLIFILMISLILITQQENITKFGKSLITNKFFTTMVVKKSGLQEKRSISSVAKKPYFQERQLVLCGVFLSGDQRFAYLKSSDGEKFILREGEYAGMFNLESVYPDSVILVWNNGKREVLRW